MRQDYDLLDWAHRSYWLPWKDSKVCHGPVNHTIPIFLHVCFLVALLLFPFSAHSEVYINVAVHRDHIKESSSPFHVHDPFKQIRAKKQVTDSPHIPLPWIQFICFHSLKFYWVLASSPNGFPLWTTESIHLEDNAHPPFTWYSCACIHLPGDAHPAGFSLIHFLGGELVHWLASLLTD